MRSLLILLFGLGCRPTLNMKITVPAAVSIDPSVTTIAVVDRVSNEYTRRAISGFIESSQGADTVRFQIIDAQQIYNSLAVPVNGPIPNDGMKKLCDSAKVKGALVLHRFTHDKSTQVTESTETRQNDDGKEVEYDVFTANYYSTMHVSWRFRGCLGETFDSYGYQVSDNWSAEGVTPGDAKSALGDTDDFDERLSNTIGGQYFKRVAPHEKWIERQPYRGPIGKKGKKFRKAVGFMKGAGWKTAEKIYLDILKNLDDIEDAKFKGKCYYNLAIVYENLGQFDSMWNYANKANKLLGSSKSSSYLNLAEQRKSASEKLEKQMKKAVQENSQDNR